MTAAVLNQMAKGQATAGSKRSASDTIHDSSPVKRQRHAINGTEAGEVQTPNVARSQVQTGSTRITRSRSSLRNPKSRSTLTAAPVERSTGYEMPDESFSKGMAPNAPIVTENIAINSGTSRVKQRARKKQGLRVLHDKIQNDSPFHGAKFDVLDPTSSNAILTSNNSPVKPPSNRLNVHKRAGFVIPHSGLRTMTNKSGSSQDPRFDTQKARTAASPQPSSSREIQTQPGAAQSPTHNLPSAHHEQAQVQAESDVDYNDRSSSPNNDSEASPIEPDAGDDIVGAAANATNSHGDVVDPSLNVEEQGDAAHEHLEVEERRCRDGEDFVRCCPLLSTHPHLGGIDKWKRIGAAAKTLKRQYPWTDKMRSPEAQKLLDAISALEKLARRGETLVTRNLNESISCLGRRSALKSLAPWQGRVPDGKTVLDLHQQIIPRLIYRLRKHLRLASDSTDSARWQQLTQLIAICKSLCEIAIENRKVPGSLQSETREEIRLQIKPALASILAELSKFVAHLDKKQRHAVMLSELTQKQQLHNRELQRFTRRWTRPGDFRQPVPSAPDIEPVTRGAPVLATSRSVSSGSVFDTEMETDHSEENQIFDIEDIEEERITWTFKQDTVLLNGLQEFEGRNRYTRVLEKHRNRLLDKTVEQCIERAQYFKKELQCGIAEGRVRDPRSYRWLLSV